LIIQGFFYGKILFEDYLENWHDTCNIKIDLNACLCIASSFVIICKNVSVAITGKLS